MRPLYIAGVPGCRVVLDEPALRVAMPDRAEQLFPLARVSRVVCQGPVDWSCSALLACADAGITVLFLAADGSLRARWLGQSGIRDRLGQRLLDLLARADGLERYRDWYAAMEKLAARSFLRRAGWAQWREVPVPHLREQLQRHWSAQTRRQLQCLQGLVQSAVVNWLRDSGLGTEVFPGSGEEVDLAGDFSRLLLWDLYLALPKSEHVAIQPADYSALVTLVEQKSGRLFDLYKSTLSKLQQFVSGV